MKYTLIPILFLTFLSQSFSQVVINEYSASNLNSFLDGFGKSEDWIELYNTSAEDFDLSGYHLSDKEGKPGKWEIPEGTIIGANDFLIFSCSGRDGMFFGNLHTSFKLTQTKAGEGVLLSDPQENIINYLPLELTLVEHSRCRTTDGGDDWVICTNPSYGSSNNETDQMLGYTTAPSMDLNAGFYNGPQTITITNNEPNSIVRYTLDGTNPLMSDSIYSEPITIDKTTVIKAAAFSKADSTMLTGKMDFNTYFIDEDFSLAVYSVAADQVINLANGDGDLIPIGSIEYFNLDKDREAKSFGSLNRHGQDSWVLDHRSLDWVSRDEMGYSKAVDAPIFSYSKRDSYQKFMFRNSGDDNYPAINDFEHEGSTHIRDEYVQELAREGGLKLDTRAVERVILFLNGEYWGVYGMRERPVDHDYTGEYYNQGKYDIQYLSTWGVTEIEYGGEKALSDWENLRDQILESDLSDPQNYQIVKDSINLLSMIDYFLVNLNVVASDWLNYNTGWWRGLNPDGDHKKWGYILWDLDATFDYYINYSGVPNISPNAKPCDLEEIADYMDQFFMYYTFQQDGDVGQHEKILLKLLEENDQFKQLYYSRYADIMNTIYTCENMNETLDRMLAVIEPEMPRQIDRWGGSMAEWEQNVARLKNFINLRCERLDNGAIDCYDDLTATHKLTLQATPAGIGEIDLNTLDIEEFPWSGDYFEGMQNKIKANVFDEFEDEYVFSHWITSANNEITPSLNAIDAEISLTNADTLTAVFALKGTVSIQETIAELGTTSIFPNPANENLTLQYNLNEAANIEIDLYNVQGQIIHSFDQYNQRQTTGTHAHTMTIPAEVTSGFYFLTLSVNGKQKQMKVSIIK